ncbi:hypothetical protein [Inquilinus sp. CAU 1745]|uniref:hypothetical protein n=1 Tax=Inquilinus sp. CAU 1745 TaxID=3140369 RepID=UPI00325C3439
MPVFRTLIWSAARRLAADPRVQKKALEMAEQARPRVEQAARDVRRIAGETSPVNDPGGFARKVRDQVLRKGPK